MIINFLNIFIHINYQKKQYYNIYTVNLKDRSLKLIFKCFVHLHALISSGLLRQIHIQKYNDDGNIIDGL